MTAIRETYENHRKKRLIMTETKRMQGIEGQAGHPALCVLPEIEKEDELFEIIWTLREEGTVTLDQIIQNCNLKEC
jgi:hypothetical protein